jgi:signal peptidase I
MFFLTPKYLKQGRLYLKEAQKRLSYNRDKWDAETIGSFQRVSDALRTAIKAKDKEAIKQEEAVLEGLCARHCPLGRDAWLGENVEVFLVAIIVALGIRTYFLQPFTIPTSSMYPTLCGVIGTKTEQEPPNVLTQIWQFAAYGRTWHNVVAEADEQITSVDETSRGGWRSIFTYTRITTDAGNTYFVNDLKQPIEDAWGRRHDVSDRGFLVGMKFKKGEPIVRGYTSTGDHVFVDKMSYHFRQPTRGEVFVFTTADIPGQAVGGIIRGAPPRPPSQFYIKRLGGVPGDTLRIVAPNLFVNDELATEWTFQRVMSGTFENPKDHYRGYSNRVNHATLGEPFPNLGVSAVPFQVGPKEYFALGDNSYNSWDSRGWGIVPERNLLGPGLFVYWPFLRDEQTHFGVIR